MDYQENIRELFRRYLADQCSEEELQILMDCFNNEANEELLKGLIRDEFDSSLNSDDQNNAEPKTTLEDIFKKIKKRIEGSE